MEISRSVQNRLILFYFICTLLVSIPSYFNNNLNKINSNMYKTTISCTTIWGILLIIRSILNIGLSFPHHAILHDKDTSIIFIHSNVLIGSFYVMTISTIQYILINNLKTPLELTLGLLLVFVNVSLICITLLFRLHETENKLKNVIIENITTVSDILLILNILLFMILFLVFY